jgi:hypothetical protein
MICHLILVKIVEKKSINRNKMDALKNQQIMIAKEKKGNEYADKGQKYCLLTDHQQSLQTNFTQYQLLHVVFHKIQVTHLCLVL